MTILGERPDAAKRPVRSGVVAQLCRAVHPQGLVDAGHHEQQADLGPLGQVRQRVEPVVARPVGQEQRVVVGHVHEPGIAPARSGVLAAVRVGRRQHDERRVRDEPAAMAVEVVELLAQRALGRRRIERPQLGLGRDCRHARHRIAGPQPSGSIPFQAGTLTVRLPAVPPRMILRRLVSLCRAHLVDRPERIGLDADVVGAVRQVGDVERLAGERLHVGVTPAGRQRLARPERGLGRRRRRRGRSRRDSTQRRAGRGRWRRSGRGRIRPSGSARPASGSS